MWKIGYESKSARELLVEMKDVSDLMVDLAYASLLFENVELANLVHELEQRMDNLMYHIRMMAIMAARNTDEARKVTGILQVASAAEAISNATGDMADLIRRRMKIHPVIQSAIRKASEKIVEVKVSEGSILAGRKLSELRHLLGIGAWLLAQRHDNKWIAPLAEDASILGGDVLIVKGPSEGVKTLLRMAGVREKPFVIGREFPFIRNVLAKMKDLTYFIVDLAYMSILLNSYEAAEEVRELEEEFDKLNYKLWLATLAAVRGLKDDIAELNSVLQIVKCMEKISDAADSIADIVLRGLELHPIFVRAIAESDEQIAKFDIPSQSPFIGKTLKELNLWEKVGVCVLMMKRGKHHIFDPDKRKIHVKKGDMLVVRGSPSGIKKLEEEILGTLSK